MRLATLFVLAAPLAAQDATFEFERGDRVVLVGNVLAERMQHDGWLEIVLQQREPELGLAFRNLGFSGDELNVRPRVSGFGTPEEWLDRVGATVVFAFFGNVESFEGRSGTARFRAELEEYVDAVRASGRRIVLFSPIPHENLGDPLLPNEEERNIEIAAYAGAMAAVAIAKDAPFVDLFGAMERAYDPALPLTRDGLHLNERGQWVLARTIEFGLYGTLHGTFGAGDAERGALLRAFVREKNHLWFNRYRATDGYNVYGGRSSLTYEGITNFDVLQRELEILDAMCANLDARIHAVARGEAIEHAPQDELPAAIVVHTNRPGDGPDGAHVYRTGAEALAAMTPAPGLEVTLVADEARFPELANPVQMSFDTRGRLWVAAWPTYPHWAPGEPMNDKLVIVLDDDGDGVADRTQVFADDLHNPTGFEFWNGGVFVANCPDLLFLKDTDGDDVADVRERVLHGLSSGDTHHSANSFVLGPDGALYFQEGTFHRTQIETIHGVVRNRDGCVWRFEPRTWRVERYVPYGFANPHGHVFDRWGQDFVTDGTGNVNYYALPFSGHLEFPARHSGYFPFFRQRSRPAGATEILSSQHFPDEYRDSYLIANVIGFQGIFQYRVRDDGSGFAADELEPLVHSSDPNFRPVDLEVAPDGSLVFLDWQTPLIGHMQHHLRDPSRDHAHGRIYRVTASDRPLVEPAVIVGRSTADLVEMLRIHDDRTRYRVRIELSARPSDEVVSLARAWPAKLDAKHPEHEHRMLEALWLQQQHGVLDHALLATLLDARDPRARAAAVRVAKQMRREVTDLPGVLRAKIDDEHPRVRLEALVALSFVPTAASAETALRVLSHPSDRFLDYALKETLRALEPHWRAALVSGEPFAAGDATGRAHVLTRLDTAELQRVHPGPAVQRELLTRHGLERAQYAQALAGLATANGTTSGTELLAAIQRADARADGHADHLLVGLFDALTAVDERASLASALRVLTTEGRRSATRRLATAARIEAEGSIDGAWSEASSSLGSLGDLLDAAPHVDDDALAGQLFERALELVDGVPAELAGDARGTVGRYVRIELLGAERTLTLAEVQVFAGEENVAPRGTATQSSVAWSGHPERAVDGNTSGRYGDGGQTHTLEGQPNPWWELDLGASVAIDAIALWNRDEADGGYTSRLDGYVVRVLDDARRTVFRHQAGAAPPKSARHELGDPALRVRRAAIRALGSLGVRHGDAVRALAQRFVDADVRTSVVASLRNVPAERWPADAAAGTARALLVHFAGGPKVDTDAGRELLAFANELAARVDAPLSGELREAARRLGPQVVVLRPVPDTLTFDRKTFDVVAGKPVELVFDNVDIMPHNVVVTAPGALAKVGRAGEAMAAQPDAWDRGYVPDLAEVLVASKLLQPGESQTLRFTAPSEPGEHPFVCTFPGHWIRMNGTMRVVADWGDVSERADQPIEASAPSRSFVRNWTVDDLAADLTRVDGRDPAAGRAVYEAASCVRCHATGDDGAHTGPDMLETVQRHDRLALLAQILEPSTTIYPGYETEVFERVDGTLVSGRVVERDGDVLLVQDDPYADDLLELPLAEIAERAQTDVSTMPSGLLSTFERDEILDLLAYLESLSPNPAPNDSR